MTDDRVRLDKWLWAARFFKTRSAATEAVAGGKIELNGERAKPAHPVQAGDTVRVRQAPFDYLVKVTGTAERRGSAAIAATLYEETPESLAQRERLREQLRLAPQIDFTEGRPGKRDRRLIDKARGRR